MAMISKVIAFSGGCFAGKTTTIEYVKSKLLEDGFKVCVFNEVIRDSLDSLKMTIDQVRSMPKVYLDLQHDVIQKKIEHEAQAFEAMKQDKHFGAHNETVYLFDRAITDSLFYYENYVDKSGLRSPELITKYVEFHSMLLAYVSPAFKLYDMVLEFSPINSLTDNDFYRPEGLGVIKYYEHACIHRLNKFYASQDIERDDRTYVRVNLNEQSKIDVYNKIKNILI